MVFVALLLMAFGLFAIISPRAMWFFSEGWKFKDAEPSGAALIVARIGGVVSLIVALVILTGWVRT